MALGSGSMLKTRNTSEILGLTRTSFFSEYQTRIQKVGEHIFVYCNNGKFDYTSRQHGGSVSQACAVYTSRQHGGPTPQAYEMYTSGQNGGPVPQACAVF